MKYKIIEEYDRFYLTEHPNGYKECFDKYTYRPTEDGYIVKKKENNCTGGIGLLPEKVNKSFNPGKKNKEG